ncbi:hypothetical protein Pfo_002254 [Paulownia fortunei]|nr:hypothetical protein Pfo_002254 [Paulownia fortunei]
MQQNYIHASGRKHFDLLWSYRCVELGPSPSDLGGQKPTRVEAIKMVSEANAEIRDMKEKMTVMEQTRAQMAAMMSSMQRNIPDNNVPDMIAITSDASGHSVPQQVITGANSPWRFNASDADMSEQKKNLEYKEHSSMQRCLFMHFGLHICLGGLTVVCVLMGFELDLLTTGCMPDMLSYFEL